MLHATRRIIDGLNEQLGKSHRLVISETGKACERGRRRRPYRYADDPPEASSYDIYWQGSWHFSLRRATPESHWEWIRRIQSPSLWGPAVEKRMVLDGLYADEVRRVYDDLRNLVYDLLEDTPVRRTRVDRLLAEDEL